MATQYYIHREDQETGPFGFRDLVAFVREGKLVDSDRVRFSWTSEWQRADSLVGLFHMARRSPEDLARHDVPSAPLVPVEPIHAQDEQVTIAEVDDRPGWMLRLLHVGGFRRKKPAEIPMLGPPPVALSEAAAACASTAQASPNQAPQELPAEIADYFNRDAAGQSDRWSSAVEEALASVTARGAGKSAKSRTSRFRKMFGGLARIIPPSVIPTREQGQSLMRNGFRIVCAIVCANLAAWAVENWSAQEALRFPSRETQQAALRQFPLLGTCGSGEYLFLMFDLMLVTGAAAWFAAGWVESHAE